MLASMDRGDRCHSQQTAASRYPDRRAVEAAMAEVKAGLSRDINVATTFRQEDHIDASIENVREALVEGSIIVALVLIPFLMNCAT